MSTLSAAERNIRMQAARDRAVAEKVVTLEPRSVRPRPSAIDALLDAPVLAKIAAFCFALGKVTGISAVLAVLTHQSIAPLMLSAYAGLIGLSVVAGVLEMALSGRKRRRREPTIEEVEALARKHGLIS